MGWLVGTFTHCLIIMHSPKACVYAEERARSKPRGTKKLGKRLVLENEHRKNTTEYFQARSFSDGFDRLIPNIFNCAPHRTCQA